MAETSSSRLSSTANGSPTRDVYIDFLRAFSLLVVVAWHWVFTIIIWQDDGPHATSPIGFTTGLWTATWLLQVMPLFLFHTTGLAAYLAVRYALAGERNEIREPTVTWWLFRPLAFVGPLLFTLPVIYLFGRQWVRHPRTKPSAPAGDRTAQTV